MASHSLLQALKANKPAFGAWLTLPGLFHARTVAQASPHLSWIAIDCEHGLIPLVPGAAESIAGMQGVSRNGVGPSPIVRISATGVAVSSSWQIKNALDAGARGIIAPMVCLIGFLVYGARRTVDLDIHRGASKADSRRQSLPPRWETWVRQSVHSRIVGDGNVRRIFRHC